MHAFRSKCLSPKMNGLKPEKVKKSKFSRPFFIYQSGSECPTLANVWGKRFKLPQLTHESFLTIDHSCKIFF